MKLRFSKAAREDLKQVAIEGLRLFGANQMQHYRKALARKIRDITALPYAYRERTELSPPQRVCRFQSHLIFYQVSDDEILIIRIRHGREDWQTE